MANAQLPEDVFEPFAPELLLFPRVLVLLFLPGAVLYWYFTGIVAAAVLASFGIVGYVGLELIIRFYWRFREGIFRCGVTCTATVLNKSFLKCATMRVKYDYNQSTYLTKTYIAWSTFLKYKVGDQITIRISTTYPSLWVPAPSEVSIDVLPIESEKEEIDQ